ncbi:hypothetical protein [Sporisorium scitamineum]|uniref:Uncharacterized protein n=1 Tax=Sporisorium scitamineum TaxID=49012 RepID=A0A0F7RUT2_9BASI|nr:hypothetical protein [Sporisorium scitamineum]
MEGMELGGAKSKGNGAGHCQHQQKLPGGEEELGTQAELAGRAP